jgi:hypothetical protein
MQVAPANSRFCGCPPLSYLASPAPSSMHASAYGEKNRRDLAG